jgi:hypothetical protein
LKHPERVQNKNRGQAGPILANVYVTFNAYLKPGLKRREGVVVKRKDWLCDLG